MLTLVVRSSFLTGAEKVFEMPRQCPVCGGEVVRQKDEVAVRCVNPACPAQLRRRLEHFASRNALDIKALGAKVADALVGKGLVKDVLDLFSLREEDVVNLDLADDAPASEPGTFFDLLKPVRKFGANGRKMLEAVAAAKGLPLHRWLLPVLPNRLQEPQFFFQEHPVWSS